MNNTTKTIYSTFYQIGLSLVLVLTFLQAFSSPPGNPSEFGQDEWKAYCYSSFSFTQYRGYFTMPEESFNTADFFTPSESPSTATWYQGLSVAGSFYSIAIKRRGFPCGEYTLNIPEYNWFGSIKVDGVTVYAYSWSSGSAGEIWTGHLGSSSTIEYLYRMPFGSGLVSLDVDLQPVPNTEWNGAQNSEWSNAANWTNGVPNGQTNATIVSASNQPILVSSSEANNLTVESGATLTFAEEQLTISGNLNLLGVMSANDGTLIFESGCPNSIQHFYMANAATLRNLRLVGDGALTLSGAPCNITGVLGVANGHLTTGDLITLVSNQNGTARLAKVGDNGQISGEITVQRHIGAALNGWVQLGTAVSEQTLANWSDDFITTGFPGSNYPNFNFNNIRMYDESPTGDMDTGLYGATDISNPVLPGVGYQVYLAQGTHNVQVTGEPMVGEHEFDITFNSSQPEFDAGFSEAHDGWNLVANPYPSAIDWGSEAGWEKANLSGAIYVWDATIGQYNLYSSGVSLNGGNNIIPSTQAFWVQANGNNPVLRINEEAKVSESGNFKSTQSTSVHYLTLTGFGKSDQVAFRLNNTSQNDSFENVAKFYSGEAVPKMGIKGSGEYDLAILGLNSAEEIQPIVLNQSYPANGNYTISLSADDDAPLTCVFLEDLETGEWFDLNDGPYDFTANESALNQRFILHFGNVFTFATQNNLCHGDSAGQISWSNPEGWNVNIINSDTNEEVTFSSPGVASNLPAGVYQVDVSCSGNCGANGQYQVSVLSISPLVAQKTITSSSCQNTSNGSVSIVASGGVAPYKIQWLDGDTSFVKSDLSVGTHFFTLFDKNGCSAEEQFEVLAETTVDADFELIQNEVFVGEPLQINNLSVGAITYNWSFGSNPEFQNDFQPVFSYEAPGNYDIMLIVQNGSCMDIDTAQVMVSEVVTSTDDILDTESITVYSRLGAIVLDTGFDSPKDLLVNVYGVNGQELLSNLASTMGNGTWEIPVNYSGAVVVQILDENQQLVKTAKLYVN